VPGKKKGVKQRKMAKIKRIIRGMAKKFKMEKELMRLWAFFKMYIYERVQIRTIDSTIGCFRTYFLGRANKKNRNMKNSKRMHSGPTFYLKINRMSEYTLMCIQHWLNIIFEMDGDFYFVCDNKRLERMIVKYLIFRDGDIKFMQSQRRKLKNVARNLWTGHWEMATYAHLTPFYHAKENGIKDFWAIDADDTMFFLYPDKVSEILKKAQEKAKEDRISAFSLDMHWNQMRGKHWSLGVLYINEGIDFCRIFENVSGLEWTEKYKEIDDVFNLDWFFNYLRDNKMTKVETFYVEDCYFCHWVPNVLRYLIGGNLCFWHENKLTFPIIKDIYKNRTLGVIDVKDSYRIIIDTTLEKGLEFMANEVSILYAFSQKARKVFGLGSYGQNSKYRLPF